MVLASVVASYSVRRRIVYKWSHLYELYGEIRQKLSKMRIDNFTPKRKRAFPSISQQKSFTISVLTAACSLFRVSQTILLLAVSDLLGKCIPTGLIIYRELNKECQTELRVVHKHTLPRREKTPHMVELWNTLLLSHVPHLNITWMVKIKSQHFNFGAGEQITKLTGFEIHRENVNVETLINPRWI